MDAILSDSEKAKRLVEIFINSYEDLFQVLKESQEK